MLNLFGAIANGLGRMLPGYLNGYRMAIQDNWNDLNQYNRAQAGQLQNAWTEAAFNPSYNQLLAQTALQQLGALDASGEFMIKQQQWPGRMMRGGMLSAAAPGLTAAGIDNTYNMYQRQAMDNALYPDVVARYQEALRTPQMPFGQGGMLNQGGLWNQVQQGMGMNPFNAQPFDAEGEARKRALPSAARG